MPSAKKICRLAPALALWICLLLAGCGRAENSPVRAPEEGAPSVTVSVTGSGGELLAEGNVSFGEGATAYDATAWVLEGAGVAFVARWSGSSVYIASIGGDEEFAAGPASGWVFSVNGERAAVGAGSVKLRDGDAIRWVYLTDALAA